MTTLDVIKTKYMLYEPVLSSSREETLKVLDVFIDDMDETIKSSRSAVNENIKDEYLTRFKNFFLNLLGFEEEDVLYFESDTGIVLRHSCLAGRYKNYFDKMKDIITDDNFQDINKLAMYTYNNYVSNYGYLESLRDRLNYSLNGVTYYGV